MRASKGKGSVGGIRQSDEDGSEEGDRFSEDEDEDDPDWAKALKAAGRRGFANKQHW